MLHDVLSKGWFIGANYVNWCKTERWHRLH